MPITRENLPYPIVQYPCGAFVAFKKDDKDDYVFCTCMYEAIENHIQIRILEREKAIKQSKESYESNKKLNRESAFILNPWDFGGNIVKELLAQGVAEDESIINYIDFVDKICHKCNQAVPAATFCNPMYGGRFKQKYGWYIKQKYYELGINPYISAYIDKLCPQEILEILNYKYIDLFNEVREKEIFRSYSDAEIENRLKEIDKLFLKKGTISSNDYDHIWAYEISKIVQKKHRIINRIIENEVRQEFNQKKIGDAWTSETILYSIIKRLYPQYVMMRHYRPRFLEYLELDIYIDELRVGIEYQGLQHFKPVKHWGGKEALKKTKERDKRKLYLCKANGIKLIYFYHDENLSEEFVIRKIEKIIDDIP